MAQQWQGLIAVNYPARKFGVNRFMPITEAKKLCPEIIMQHVATWREGDAMWDYHPDAFAQTASHKVSLDPYRLASRRILACIKESLPAPPIQRVEKASVDEVFLDLSAQVYSILLENYPELSGPAPYDDPTESLPRPPITALNWNTDALIDLDTTETEDDDPDWDDISMLIGSEIVRSVRAAIRERLQYTCSAGLGRNKMIAKLGSAHKKPNSQTVVRNRAIQQFLGGFKFTKIRNLGGKLGEQVVSIFGTDQVSELLEISLEQLKSKLSDDHATWVYETIRGDDYSEVNYRTQIKSMLSAKSFRPNINTFEQATKWLRIFVADIFSRLVEEGVRDNKRRPKTINLHHRQGGQTRSRQAAIPSGRSIDEPLLFDLAKQLMSQVIIDGRAWPCNNLSLSVGGFEDGPTGNHGIGSFLVKGDEAKAMLTTSRISDSRVPVTENGGRPGKRQKRDGGAGIQRFFAKRDMSREEDHEEYCADEQVPSVEDGTLPYHAADSASLDRDHPDDGSRHAPIPNDRPVHPAFSTTYLCSECHAALPLATKTEHDDWHFAKDLQASENDVASPAGGAPVADTSSASAKKQASAVVPTREPKKPGGGPVGGSYSGAERKGVEKGQRRLAFGP